MTKINLPDFLKTQMAEKNWTANDLADHSDTSLKTISHILSGEKEPDVTTLNNIAHALQLSPVILYRQAGWLPEGDETLSFDDMEHLLQQLTPADQKIIRDIIKLKAERKNKR